MGFQNNGHRISVEHQMVMKNIGFLWEESWGEFPIPSTHQHRAEELISGHCTALNLQSRPSAAPKNAFAKKKRPTHMQTPPATRQIAKKAYFSDYMEFAPQQYESFRKEPWRSGEKVTLRRPPVTSAGNDVRNLPNKATQPSRAMFGKKYFSWENSALKHQVLWEMPGNNHSLNLTNCLEFTRGPLSNIGGFNFGSEHFRALTSSK